MKKDITQYNSNGRLIECWKYHPNGRLKYLANYYSNGNKKDETFFCEDGCCHRKKFPASLEWHEDGKLIYCSYYTYGWTHNNNNPATIYFNNKGKINEKYYMNWGKGYLKLDWMNCIKEI